MGNKEDEQVLDIYSFASKARRLFRKPGGFVNSVIADARIFRAPVKLHSRTWGDSEEYVTSGLQVRFENELELLREKPPVDISDLLHELRVDRGTGPVQKALKAMEMKNPSRTAIGRHVEQKYYAGEVVVEAAGRDPQTNQIVYAVSNEHGRIPLAAESYKKELARG
jgi:hypothetical protein